MEQLSEAFDAWSTGRDPDWSRITRADVIRGDLDRWSDRLRITVDLGRLPGEIESRRKSRDRAHEGLRQLWEKWASQGAVPFDDRFQEEASRSRDGSPRSSSEAAMVSPTDEVGWWAV